MTLRCTKCGAVLPKDDARSCNNCGTLISPRPAHPTLTAVPKSETDSPLGSKPGLPQTASEQKGSTPALREQVAQQPPARPMGLVTPDEVSPPAGKWERQDKLDKAPIRGGKEKQEVQASTMAQGQIDEDPPTRPLAAHPPVSPKQPGTFSTSAHPIQRTHQDEVELLDTVPLAAPVQSGPITPMPSVPPMSQQASTGEVRWKQGLLQRQHVKENVPSPIAFPPQPVRRRHHTSLPVLVALFCLLVLAGLGIWIVKLQAFSVPAVTQPQQRFKGTNLGLSLLYPTGWTTQIDHAKSTVRFYDSSHTAEVVIAVKDPATGDVTQYLQQQVTQLGMTGTKAGTSLSFAGATWQSVQGSVQLSGASYTGTILATVHRRRLFAFIQLAPQSIYTDEDKLVFADMRSSLQFV